LETSELKNYILHGVGLSVLMFLITIGWVIAFAILLVLGSFIGLILGLVLLVLLIGYANDYIASWVWKMRIQEGTLSHIIHGTVLFVLLLIVSIPVLLINYLLSNWVVSLALFIVYIPIHGFVGRYVARMYEAGYQEPLSYPTEEWPAP